MVIRRFVLVPSGDMSVDGHRVGNNTASRIDTAIFYNDETKADVIVLSGGKLRAGQEKSDSEVMYDYLAERANLRLPVILEREAADTFENIRCSMKAIDEYMRSAETVPDIYHVIVPSEKNHLRRFELGFKRLNSIRERRRRRDGVRFDNVPIKFTGVEAGRGLSVKERLFEWAFFNLVVRFDPLGVRSKIAARIRDGRRRAGQS